MFKRFISEVIAEKEAKPRGLVKYLLIDGQI